MNYSRVRTAVSPLRRRFPAATMALPSVDELIATERPEEPMHCMRPATVEATAREFVAAFPGDVLFAVKCNRNRQCCAPSTPAVSRISTARRSAR
jgi:ornithine decarboxylase